MPTEEEKKIFLKKILLSGRTDLNRTDEKAQRLIVFNLFSFVGVVSFLVFSFVNFRIASYLPAVLEFAVAFVYFFNMLVLRVHKNTRFASRIALITHLVAMIFLFLTGGIANTGVLWLFSYPVIALFLDNRTNGVFWIVLLMILIVFIGVGDALHMFNTPYSPGMVMITLASLLVISLLSYFYAWVDETGHALLIEQKHSLIERRDKLEQVNESLRQANILIEHEQSKYITTLRSIGDGVLVLDKNKKITFVNPVAESLTGFKQKDLIWTNVYEKVKFISLDTHRERRAFIDNVYKYGDHSKMDRGTGLVRKDGSVTPVGDSAAPIKNVYGQVIGCVIVFRDVTKEFEIDKAKSEFIYVVSHQLKTPLGTLKWLLELMNESNLSKKEQDYTGQMSDTVTSMSGLVNDLLDVSRIERGKKFSVEPEKQDIIPILKKEIRRVKHAAKEKEITLITTKNIPKKRELSVDKQKIAQVFHNLLTNAVKYTKNEGKVEIGYSKEDDGHIFYVKDTGIGIPKDEQPLMFKKFARAANAQRTEEGTGLGLYIVKAIMDGHKGKVWFESQEGKGTTFYILIP